jgi:hypothetical protein
MNDAETRQRFIDIDARLSISPSPAQFGEEIRFEAAQWQEYAEAIVETPLIESSG